MLRLAPRALLALALAPVPGLAAELPAEPPDAAAPPAAGSAEAAAPDAPSTSVLDVAVGESLIQRARRPIARVLVSDPAVADIRLLEEGQYQVRGLAVGSTDLWVWYRDDVANPVQFQVVVATDLTDLRRRVAAAAGAQPAPAIYAVRERLVVEGAVEDLETLERVAAIARLHDPDFVNLMSVRGDHQVQLDVVFAEVSRSGLRELGLGALFDDHAGVSGALSGFTPGADAFQLLGTVSGAFDLSVLLAVLEENALSRTLAEPTLTALSGQQAEMLAGGRLPVPVGQGDERMSVEFQEYGVKLVFVPTVLAGETIDVRAYVEVSELDPTTAVRLADTEVPGVLVRKGDSHLRLASGMTFAMAGMLHERTSATRAAIPLLGDLPLVGALFRYVKHAREETELVIFVTPRLVRPLAPGEVPELPGPQFAMDPNDLELYLLGRLDAGGARTAAPAGAFGMQR